MEQNEKYMDYINKLQLLPSENKILSPLQRKRKIERGVKTSTQLRKIRRSAIRYINPDVEP
jgi:hypothetical protein